MSASTWTDVDLDDPSSVLRHALAQHHPRLAIACSFSREDVLLVALAAAIEPDVRVVSLDTGRLPEETYRCAEAVRHHVGVRIEWLAPRAEDLEALLREDGPLGFKQSLEARHRCCHARKVAPIARVLDDLAVWVTGQRRSQSVTRVDLQVVERDGALLKLNPLAAWSAERVEAETTRRNLPVHALYAKGYTSIGCVPCTRAIGAGEHERAGRWWWETPEHKECGLHLPLATAPAVGA